MNGPNVNIAQDIVAPFSLQTYEVLGETWAEYRDRENVDFHIGLRLAQAPVYDIGVSGFFGTANGQDIEEPITVRTWVTNYGNQPAAGFPLSYRFGNDAPVTQNYTGPAIQPAQQVLFSFTQQFDPNVTTTGDLCGWSGWAQDEDATNDTTCVTVNVFVGMEERPGQWVRSWPNPVRGSLFVELQRAGPTMVEVVDAQGRLVRSEQHLAGSAPLTIAMNDLCEGLYHLRITIGNEVFRSHVVVGP